VFNKGLYQVRIEGGKKRTGDDADDDDGIMALLNGKQRNRVSSKKVR
jgi:hypothetical protein